MLGASLCVLVAVRELSGSTADRVAANPAHAGFGMVDGVRVVAQTPGLRRALFLLGAGAALMLPVQSLLVPLLGRASSWGPGSTGAVAGAVGIGVICAAVLVARRQSAAPGAGAAPASTGLLVSAAGAFVLAVGPAFDGSEALSIAIGGALLFGFGNGMFVARLAPFVLGSAPRTHLARVQALVGLVQLVPVMATNTALGSLSQNTSPGWALGVTAAALTACGVWARRRTIATAPASNAERAAVDASEIAPVVGSDSP